IVNGSIGQSHWLACLYRLFNDSVILACDPSSCKILAFAPSLAVSRAAAALDRSVDRGWTHHRSLAARCAVLQFMDLGTRRSSFRRRTLALFEIGEAFQRSATRRNSRSYARCSRTAADHCRDTQPHPSSSLSCTFLRNARLESWHWSRCLLRIDCVRANDRSGHDQTW